jgi:hypothetical protein
MALHFLSQKYDSPVTYTREAEFNEFGLHFHKPSGTIHARRLGLKEESFMPFIEAEGAQEPATLYSEAETYFQTAAFADHLKKYFADPRNIAPIQAANPWAHRYKANNSIFIHVRLGDATHQTPPSSYFEEQLDTLSYTDGYIASDTPNHPIVRHLIQKYRLRPFQDTEIRTIQFANTCKYVILSHGTFSWLLGFFAFNSQVFCPPWKATWHGDIFGVF